MDATFLRSINSFNSRCLARITNREIRDEAKDPTFDLCMHLRSQRLRFLGHVLRADEDSIVRRVILSQGTNHRNGDLFTDAPVHDTLDDLIEIARDRDQWRQLVEELAGNGRFSTTKANTAAQTAAEIDALPSHTILAYTDGGCDGNGAHGKWGAAGWGAWMCNKNKEAIADLWGPVVTDPKDEFYCGCTGATNNTGELTGMLNALYWAKQHGGHEPFAICFDSMYAKNITTKVWNAKANKGIAKLCQDALTAENERRQGGVHFVHVKGHSEDKGNDKADERVQWGKVTGPFCRFRSDGTSQGDYINSPYPSTSKHGISPLSSPSPSLRFSLSTSYTEATAPKARRQLFNLSISPVATMSSPTSTPSQSTGLLSSSLESSCTTQDVNLARRNHSHQHSYNTRSQPNRNSAMHTPESCNVLNTE